MKMIIYKIADGKILAVVDGNQVLERYLSEMPKKELQQLDSIYLDNIPQNIYDYNVINGQLMKAEVEDKFEPVINPLEERIVELENIIDVMLGVDTDGL